jgi:hypothetical protein
MIYTVGQVLYKCTTVKAFTTFYSSLNPELRNLNPPVRVSVEMSIPSRVELKCNAEGFDVILTPSESSN